MNNSVLRLSGIAALAIMAGSVMSTPASAFILSPQQGNHIAKYIKCQTFLLKGDLVSFEDDPDCGGGPASLSNNSLGVTNNDDPDEPCIRPSVTLFSDSYDDNYCYPDYENNPE